MDEYREELAKCVNTPSLSELGETNFKNHARVAGLITDVANFGNRVAVTLDDGTCRLEVSCFTEQYARLKDTLKVGEIIVARLSVRENDGRLFARLHTATNLIQARLTYLSGIHIRLGSHDLDRLHTLLGLLKEHKPPEPKELETLIQKSQNSDDNGEPEDTPPDGCLPVLLYLYDECSKCQVAVNERFRLYPSDETLSLLRQTFGKDDLVIK